MRRVGSSALSLGLLGIAAAATWGQGCSAKKPTELVPGVFSQVQVPKNLVQVRLDVKANGATKFCQTYDATNGTVLLPATLGVVSGEAPSTTVTVEIRGYDKAGAGGPDQTSCGSAPVNATATMGGPGPRILRRSIQTFVDQHILFLPMPLSYSCFDQDCSTGATLSCKGAQCVSALTDEHTLVDFEPSLVDGTQDCFDATRCFGGEVSAVTIDADNCVYGFPPMQLAGSGLNVRIFYQDMAWKLNPATQAYEPQVVPTSEQEILDEEDTEGFTVLANQQFQLSKGLCSLVRAANVAPPPPPSQGGPPTYRTISSVLASNQCEPKTQLRPICKGDRPGATLTADGGTTTDLTCNVPMALSPVPSAIYLVMDKAHEMSGAFGPMGYATAMNLSLGAPTFKRTYVGFQFLKNDPTDCTKPTPSGYTPEVDFGLAPSTQPAIAKALLSWTDPGPLPLYLEAAMRPEAAYKRVQQFADGLGEQLNLGAVLFFVNREPYSPLSAGGGDAGAGTDGGTRPDAGTSDAGTSDAGTSDAGTSDAGGGDAGLGPTFGLDCPQTNGADPTSAAIATIKAAVQGAAAGTPSIHTYFVVLDNREHMSPLAFFKNNFESVGATILDATSAQPSAVVANFAQTVVSLGTCLYELPPGLDSSAKLQFTNPLGPQAADIPYAEGCSAATADSANGWAIDNGRIRICGMACTNLRNTVLAVTSQALQAGAGGGGDAGPPVPEVPVTATMACATTH
jgi:hypothetical protein